MLYLVHSIHQIAMTKRKCFGTFKRKQNFAHFNCENNTRIMGCRRKQYIRRPLIMYDYILL